MTIKCRRCGSPMKHGAFDTQKYVFGEHAFAVKLNALACACGELLIELPELKRAELMVSTRLLVSGTTSGEALRFVRKALGLRGDELSALLGVRSEAIARWESGAQKPERPVLFVLAALVSDAQRGRTFTRDWLEAMAKPGPLAKITSL